MNGGEIQSGRSVENSSGIRMNVVLFVVKGDAIRGVGAQMSGGNFVVIGEDQTIITRF